jgi:hypothetical protein
MDFALREENVRHVDYPSLQLQHQPYSKLSRILGEHHMPTELFPYRRGSFWAYIRVATGAPRGRDNGLVSHVRCRKPDVRVQIGRAEHAFVASQLFAEIFAATRRDWPFCLRILRQPFAGCAGLRIDPRWLIQGRFRLTWRRQRPKQQRDAARDHQRFREHHNITLPLAD